MPNRIGNGIVSNETLFDINADMALVPKIAFAMFLCPSRLQIPLLKLSLQMLV